MFYKEVFSLFRAVSASTPNPYRLIDKIATPSRPSAVATSVSVRLFVFIRSSATVEVGDTTDDPLGAFRMMPDNDISEETSITLIGQPPVAVLSVVTTICASACVDVRAKAPDASV